MPRVSAIPFEKIDTELQAVMREYDKELGGSEFMQVFAQAPEVLLTKPRSLQLSAALAEE